MDMILIMGDNSIAAINTVAQMIWGVDAKNVVEYNPTNEQQEFVSIRGPYSELSINNVELLKHVEIPFAIDFSDFRDVNHAYLFDGKEINYNFWTREVISALRSTEADIQSKSDAVHMAFTTKTGVMAGKLAEQVNYSPLSLT